MSTASRAGDGTHGEAGAPPVPADGAIAATAGRSGSASWRAPAGLVIIAATVAGLVLRALLLTRPGFLTSGTVEYDDGVYLGAAIRLLQGAVPYRDFAYVQPPGILVVSLPFALVAKTVSASAGLACARVATMLASAACVPLAGRLMRHKGVLATLVTCGFLALYPADLLTARTLLLEPWMNLCCLLAVNAAFSRGRLVSPRRLAWAGAALGFATAIKFWAAIPAAVLLCFLLAGDGRWRRARGYLAGLVAGFAVPVIPFAAAAPLAFVRSTVFDQVTRMGSYTSLGARLAYLTGLMPVIDGHGHVNLSAHEHSLLAVGSNGTMVVSGIGRAPYAVAALGVVVLAAAYLRRPSSRSPLEWFALVVAAGAAAAVGMYSAFFYHYPDFPAPWLAIAFGAAAAAAAGAMTRAPGAARVAGKRAQQVVAATMAVAVTAIAVLEGSQLAWQAAPYSPGAAGRIIPAGACVVTDQVSFTIAADRFTAARPGCPDVLDSLAATLVLSGGVSVPGGAGQMPSVRQGWEAIFAKAQYVWLTQGSRNRIPWTSSLSTWFGAHFRLVRTFRGYGHSELYERIG
jgi:alpha-1,2-mannosyltransferase